MEHKLTTSADGRGLLAAVTGGTGLLLTDFGRLSETGKGDITLRIAPVLADIAKGHTIGTVGYNGQVPGPLVRMREGVPVTIDLLNDTDTAEFVHLHRLIVPADVDGAAEEKSLIVPVRTPSLQLEAATFRCPVRTSARSGDGRSEPHRAVRHGLYRAIMTFVVALEGHEG